ncbi:MAG: hypothetical protein K2O18_19665, partial [Oscillospiraceae bacterium]|nr:hypothetical protein [Oscillospiraceae bacterium]
LKAVGSVKPVDIIGIGQALSGFMQELGNIFLNLFDKGYDSEDDIPRKAKYRRDAYLAYQNSKPPAVTDELRGSISSELCAEFQKTGICGIPEQMIRGLANDIMCALYLSE